MTIYTESVCTSIREASDSTFVGIVYMKENSSGMQESASEKIQ